MAYWNETITKGYYFENYTTAEENLVQACKTYSNFPNEKNFKALNDCMMNVHGNRTNEKEVAWYYDAIPVRIDNIEFVDKNGNAQKVKFFRHYPKEHLFRELAELFPVDGVTIRVTYHREF